MTNINGRPLNNYLRSYRRHAHLTQEELAHLLGAATAAKVSRYETGNRIPTLQTGLAYEAALGVPVAKLFHGSYEEIVVINHPIFGHSRRAFLVQAKKLFQKGPSREFSIYSSYESYKKEQAAFLKDLARRFDASNSVFYLWYNPPSAGFPDGDAKIIRAYEANGHSPAHWHHIHPFLDELMEMGFPLAVGGYGTGGRSSPEDEDRAREWRARQPALRVSELDTVLSLTAGGAVPGLKPLYDARLERSHRRLSFSPFADFFLLALANSNYGSEKAEWLALAEGRKVSMPPNQSKEISPLDEMERPPIPRHTLTVTVRSTLPQVG